jgi:hypothetical protein
MIYYNFIEFFVTYLKHISRKSIVIITMIIAVVITLATRPQYNRRLELRLNIELPRFHEPRAECNHSSSGNCWVDGPSSYTGLYTATLTHSRSDNCNLLRTPKHHRLSGQPLKYPTTSSGTGWTTHLSGLAS